jgi:hypothetical protein
VVINILVRCIWRVPVHVVWLAWDAVLHPVLKMLLVLVWPRGAISWDFWRIVFCTIWLEHIKEEAGGNVSAVVRPDCRLATSAFSASGPHIHFLLCAAGTVHPRPD